MSCSSPPGVSAQGPEGHGPHLLLGRPAEPAQRRQPSFPCQLGPAVQILSAHQQLQSHLPAAPRQGTRDTEMIHLVTHIKLLLFLYHFGPKICISKSDEKCCAIQPCANWFCFFHITEPHRYDLVCQLYDYH